jgi:lipooligosaccharide transport system permease protein
VRWLTAATDWQSRAVVARHFSVYRRNWWTAFLPPALEPITMLFAFGLGLGGWVAGIEWHGREVPYMSYVAPGLLAYVVFMSAIFQTLFASFIRMHYQRTWEGQLTTQVELRHVVWGEVLWAGVLATTYFVIVALVLVLCQVAGLVRFDIALLPLLVPIAFVAACAFGALGLCFTALVPTIDHMNLPVFLLVLPMGLVSGTYFPLVHPWLSVIAVPNPLYHLAEMNRAFLLGASASGHLAAALLMSLAMICVLVPLNLRLLRRRVLGED